MWVWSQSTCLLSHLLPMSSGLDVAASYLMGRLANHPCFCVFFFPNMKSLPTTFMWEDIG